MTRSPQTEPRAAGGWAARLFGWAVVAAVLAVVIAALVVIGTPAQERKRKADHQRVEDLIALSSAIDLYYREKKVLPEALSRLPTRPDTPELHTTNVATGKPYGYRKLAATGYELCTTFDTESSQDLEVVRGAADWDPVNRPFWRHAAGAKCFQFDARDKARNGSTGMGR